MPNLLNRSSMDVARRLGGAKSAESISMTRNNVVRRHIHLRPSKVNCSATELEGGGTTDDVEASAFVGDLYRGLP